MDKNIDIYTVPGNYTQNWFLGNREKWWEELQVYRDQPVNFLEVGSYEGQSAVWNLKNILTHEKATLTVVDSFLGGDDQLAFMDDIKDGKLFATFKANIAPWEHKVKIRQGMTDDILPVLRKGFYTWAYIDAGHSADSVYKDAKNVWPLLKKGGLLFLDDYTWSHMYIGMPDKVDQDPRFGIDRFLEEITGKYEAIYKLHQLHLKKL